MHKGWTGERLETHIFNETTMEHLHRYAIAMELVKGKNVLDIACGEGYGSNLLIQSAASVTGIDIDQSTIDSATNKYQNVHLNFKQGDIHNIPSKDEVFDVIISFETLEHTSNHTNVMMEFKRVLKTNGLLIISTPDKLNYSDKPGNNNPHHLQELYKEEFIHLLKNNFKFTRFLHQQLITSSAILNEEPRSLNLFKGDFSKIEKADRTAGIYFFALASDAELPILNDSLFLGEGIINRALFRQEKMITSTKTYRLGHAILYPFKLIRNLFSK